MLLLLEGQIQSAVLWYADSKVQRSVMRLSGRLDVLLHCMTANCLMQGQGAILPALQQATKFTFLDNSRTLAACTSCDCNCAAASAISLRAATSCSRAASCCCSCLSCTPQVYKTLKNLLCFMRYRPRHVDRLPDAACPHPWLVYNLCSGMC